MASGTWKWYGKAFISLFNKEIDFNSDSIRIINTAAAHTPDQDVHDYLDDLTSIVSGINVPSTGLVLDNCTMTYTGATNVFKIDADDESVSTATATGIKNSHIVDYSPASDATRPLLGYIVWDSTLDPNAGTLLYTFDSAGLATITLSA